MIGHVNRNFVARGDNRTAVIFAKRLEIIDVVRCEQTWTLHVTAEIPAVVGNVDVAAANLGVVDGNTGMSSEINGTSQIFVVVVLPITVVDLNSAAEGLLTTYLDIGVRLVAQHNLGRVQRDCYAVRITSTACDARALFG